MGPVRIRRRSALAGGIALVLAGTAGCTSKPSGENTEQARNLVIGATAQPQSMDPTTQSGAAIPQALLYNLYETLVKIDGEGKLKPLLAKAWTVSPDRLTYTFTLQPGAKFSTGEPVTAQAVVDNINRIKSGKKILALLAKQMSVVADAAATDDQTVTVKLSRPSQSWLYNMASAAGVIADPNAFDTLASKPVGSGPFSFGEWKQGESVSLDRNQEYWGTAARFDKATFRYFADANSMSSAMLSGELDVISDLTAPEALDQFSDTSKYTIVEGTSNGEVLLGMNQGKGGNPALKNLKVRQAINHAIDCQALLNAVWGGKGTLIGSMVPPTDPWYEDLSKTYGYDPAKAKQLLAEAKVSGLKLRLRVPTLPYGPSAAQFIASQLKAVGITVSVEELDWARWLKEVHGDGNYDMTIVNHVEPRDIVQFADPSYYWHYDNPAFAKLIAQADAADNTQYVNLMKQAARTIATDAAAGFLWLFPHIAVAKADITGMVANATNSSFDVTMLASRNG
ncbi:ABC transporter substrate-binding protein [Luteococcus japonicus]|uniref:Oligopeptide ABC transporter, periplasmic oligopeptide-binding protein OppA (TC 3.A.1.5.1) n=1 Tax=Luteococcus japonicus LSP_Lj1 TaxID=1255658 RepID=A0A1R4JNT7_9ACTN|nr:ABC transporter substrate-binding protein [Luteococcus japonicus]SJN33455.1 Oligopeptide ABC transporter, periplasmic oligopeptide-binding protein OppA (TC 3.A.1.5.1) [Luteococcus japonicus LSP_Lj1]